QYREQLLEFGDTQLSQFPGFEFDNGRARKIGERRQLRLRQAEREACFTDDGGGFLQHHSEIKPNVPPVNVKYIRHFSSRSAWTRHPLPVVRYSGFLSSKSREVLGKNRRLISGCAPLLKPYNSAELHQQHCLQ